GGGGGGGGGGAAGGGGGGAAGAGGFWAPSQPGAAVAGVQPESRQHSSLVPFFQTVPSVARQLSTVFAWANATIGAASAADAKSTATLFNFFMVLLSSKAAVGLRNVQ
ncbi:MAG: hypothetical protein KGI90_16730, partial [Burkholderiales bacterium]|nr:hypothetical protein [Burkholderiales bacterium]